MDIRWSNIAFFALVIFTLAWAVRAQDSLFTFVSRIGKVGPEHPTDDRLFGLMLFGLLMVSLVGVIKVLLSSQDRE